MWKSDAYSAVGLRLAQLRGEAPSGRKFNAAYKIEESKAEAKPELRQTVIKFKDGSTETIPNFVLSKSDRSYLKEKQMQASQKKEPTGISVYAGDGSLHFFIANEHAVGLGWNNLFIGQTFPVINKIWRISSAVWLGTAIRAAVEMLFYGKGFVCVLDRNTGHVVGAVPKSHGLIPLIETREDFFLRNGVAPNEPAKAQGWVFWEKFEPKDEPTRRTIPTSRTITKAKW